MRSDKLLPYRLPYLNESEDSGNTLLTRNKPLHRHISVNLQKLVGQSTEILDKAILKMSMKQANIPHKKKYMHDEQDNRKNITDVQTRNDLEPSNVKPLHKDVEEIANNLGLSFIPPIHSHQKPLLRIGKYYTQYKFLGELENLKEKLVMEKEDDVQFRLTVQKPYVMLHDALEELILRTVEGADDIRQSVKEIERIAKSATQKPSTCPNKKEIPDGAQRLFLKNQTNMGFSTFKAVERAYRDRDKAEQLLKRSRLVKRIQDQEKSGKIKVDRHKRNYKNDACLRKHTDRVDVLEELEARRLRDTLAHDKMAAMKAALLESQKKAKQNYKFALGFRSQIASVGKALANHDFGKKKEEVNEKKKKLFSELRNDSEDKRNLVEDYRQQQKVTRQNDTATMKEDVEMKLLQNNAKREVELQQRLKQHQEKSLRQLRSPTVLRIRELHPVDMDDCLNLRNRSHRFLRELEYDNNSCI